MPEHTGVPHAVETIGLFHAQVARREDDQRLQPSPDDRELAALCPLDEPQFTGAHLEREHAEVVVPNESDERMLDRNRIVCPQGLMEVIPLGRDGDTCAPPVGVLPAAGVALAVDGTPKRDLAEGDLWPARYRVVVSPDPVEEVEQRVAPLIPREVGIHRNLNAIVVRHGIPFGPQKQCP